MKGDKIHLQCHTVLGNRYFRTIVYWVVLHKCKVGSHNQASEKSLIKTRERWIQKVFVAWHEHWYWNWEILGRLARVLVTLLAEIETRCSMHPLASSARVGWPNFLTTTKTSLSENSVLLYLQKSHDHHYKHANKYKNKQRYQQILTWWNHLRQSSPRDHPAAQRKASSWYQLLK